MQQSVETKSPKTLSSGKCIMIFFLAIIALGIEFALYMSFGVGAAFAGMEKGLPIIAVFFVTLMIYTSLIGIAALVGAIVSSLRGGETASYKIMILTMVIGLVLLVLINGVAYISINRTDPVSPGKEITSAPVDTAAVNLKNYLDKVVVSKIEVGETWSRDYGVFGEIKNTGNRTLEKVEITVYALDSSGQEVYENKFHPVLVSQWGFDDEGPLKPNYSRKFGYRMRDAPSDWSKKVRVEVSDIKFQVPE